MLRKDRAVSPNISEKDDAQDMLKPACVTGFALNQDCTRISRADPSDTMTPAMHLPHRCKKCAGASSARDRRNRTK
jgi:hypothetical protein